MRSYGKLTAGLLAAWFLFTLIGSAKGLFNNAVGGVGVAVGVAAFAPFLSFLLWFGTSRNFRQFALSLNPRTLTLTHIFRLIGFTFVLLEAKNLLPAVFALPAGYGDMAIGATATLVAWKLTEPNHRGSFIFWQLLGIADLVTAVSLGTTARVINPDGVSTVLMTVLPLSLIPTFFVPLFLMSHVISIAQARKWPVEPKHEQTLAYSAVNTSM